MQHNQAFLQLVEDALTRIAEISLEEVRARQERGEDITLIDVREESEWNSRRIPGAIWLGKGIIERDIQKTVADPQCEIILYCGGGFRSALAADNLQKMGYAQVKSMAGGVRGWVQAGFPLDEV